MVKSHQVETDMENGPQQMAEPWGRALREARISRGLSIEDVCDEIHLEKKLIESIEAEEVGQLPTSSFVKGYLRSYAKLLGLDYEPLVAAYNAMHGGNEPALTRVVRVKEVSSRDAAPRYATWILAAVLGLSVVIWWWSEVLTPVAVEVRTHDELVGSELLSPADHSGLIMPAEPELSGTLAPLLPPEDAMQPALDEAPAAAEPLPAEPAPVAAAAPAPTIKLVFEQDSWVEIHDADGKRLLMDLGKAGQSRNVDGKAPFRVLLGNSPGVKLELNGKPYDHSEFNNKGIARFTLGE